MIPDPLPPTRRIPSILRPFYEFLVPPSCLCCGAPLAPGEDIVCPGCWSGVQGVDEEGPLYREALCRLTDPGPCDDLAAAFVFSREGAIQALLHRLKYGGMTRVGEAFGMFLAGLPCGRRLAARRPILLPVPLHRAKQRERGYNQSAAICRGFASPTGCVVRENLLRRIRFTRSQTGLDLAERTRNVAGAFALRSGAEEALRGRVVLLVDDVVTTGATLTACAAVLRAAGARSVCAAAAALAPHTPPAGKPRPD